MNVSTDKLRIGMYVSRLDRPWLETPFLFQGFCIRTQHEIQELQRYCDQVVIDLEQSPGVTADSSLLPTTTLKEELRPDRKPRPLASYFRRLVSAFTRRKTKITDTPKPGDFYQDTVDIKTEIGAAQEIHKSSTENVADVLDSIRQGAVIEIPKLQAVAGSMVDSVLRNSAAMALLVRMKKKDDYTYAHSISSSIWTIVFGRHLGLDKESLEAAGLGGLLLDVGKTKLPKELLTKKGKLTPDELAAVHQHVSLGLDLVGKQDGVDQRVIDMIATHHERADGSGYPRGLKGNQIPVFGRIGGIVDSYSAMTSDRPYGSALSSYDAMRELKASSNRLFQSEMVEQFIQAIGIFPTGTVIELSTGEVGIVVKEHKFHRLQPEVAVILDADKKPLTEFKVIDLHADGGDENASPAVWIERGVEPDAYNIDPSEYFL